MWCRMTDLNRRPTDYKSVALPTELIRQEIATILFLIQTLNYYSIQLNNVLIYTRFPVKYKPKKSNKVNILIKNSAKLVK